MNLSYKKKKALVSWLLLLVFTIVYLTNKGSFSQVTKMSLNPEDYKELEISVRHSSSNATDVRVTEDTEIIGEFLTYIEKYSFRRIIKKSFYRADEKTFSIRLIPKTTADKYISIYILNDEYIQLLSRDTDKHYNKAYETVNKRFDLNFIEGLYNSIPNSN